MSKTSSKRSLLGRFLSVRGGALLGVAATSAIVLSGCLERPVQPLQPKTSNVFVRQIVNTEIDKIDLLFMVDNSVSMADKQAILEKAVPQMVTRLVTPDCVNGDKTVREPAAGDGSCSDGLNPEFNPIKNIHIGVITSSLGGHGTARCSSTELLHNDADNEQTVHANDAAYLIPKVRTVAATNPGGTAISFPPYNTTFPFLVWRPQQVENEPAGESDAAQLIADFSAQVVGAGESGCGYEASLEAWYRFLVDPSPPAKIVINGQDSVMDGVDQYILDQRKAFLRPDSLVAIILLSDENDCSAMDGGDYYANATRGWVVADVGVASVRSTSACDANPNDPCCYTCRLPAAPPECPRPEVHADCTAADPTLPAEKDSANLRCFQQKKRFGFDLLYPTQRYVDALRNVQIPDARFGADKALVDNPLLVGADGTRRDASFVFFAGIVGVPWQDLATEDTLNDPARLKYRKASELAEANVTVAGQTTQVSRWDLILGNPGLPADSVVCVQNPGDPRCLSGRETADGKSCSTAPTDPACAPVLPLDPFMIESFEPRTAGLANPITGDTINSRESGTWNKINGHEYDALAEISAGFADLQYACIFSLQDFGGVKEDCDGSSGACDCVSDGSSAPPGDRPLCQTGEGQPYVNSQYWGKAYPGTRILQVLKDFGDNAIVASICPKVATDGAEDYGYNPAVGAIVDRLAEKLGGSCLPRKLKVANKETGEVPCKIVEALPSAVDCGLPGRAPVADKKLLDAVRLQLDELALCGDKAGRKCEDWNMCEIKLVDQADLAKCQNDETYVGGAGYCYIDPAQDLGNPELVKQCDATQKQQLRFVDDDPAVNPKMPIKGSVTLVACTAEQVTLDE